MNKKFNFLLLFILALSFAGNAHVTDSIQRYDSLKIASNFVNETRAINVWTPPFYSEGDDLFPVIYMLE